MSNDDSIPESAKVVTLNIIDELTTDIILNHNDRVGKWEAVKHFQQTLPLHAQRTREAHVLVATILTAVTSWDAYDTTFQDSKQAASEQLFDTMPAPPLVYWSEAHWESLSQLIFKLMQILGAKENTTLENVVSVIELNQRLVVVRLKLEEELSVKDSGPVVIDEEAVAAFIENLEKVDDQDLRSELENLLADREDGNVPRKRREEALKPIQELKPVLRSEPFAFGYVQRKVCKLIVRWSCEFMLSLRDYLDEPRLHDASGGRDVQRENSQATEQGASEIGKVRDQSSRGQAEARAIATRPGGVQIMGDEDEDNLRDKDSGSQAPSFGTPKKRKQRVNFTTEEKDAIKKGVEELGKGRWREIKDMFPEELVNREPAAIKGCYRTMVRKGEILESNGDDDSEGTGEAVEDGRDKPAKRMRTQDSPAETARTDGRRARRPWTGTEKSAIWHGVRQFGVGKWAEIKKEFKSQLATRTTVQIKDCYRTMCKRGEA